MSNNNHKIACFKRVIKQRSDPDESNLGRCWWVESYLFKVSPPMMWRRWNDLTRRERKRGCRIEHATSFIIVSASDIPAMMNHTDSFIHRVTGESKSVSIVEMFGIQPEVYIFPADKFGNWKSNFEMEASQRGTLDHAKVLKEFGYNVIGMPKEPLTMKAEVVA